jgi:hypothetical protein
MPVMPPTEAAAWMRQMNRQFRLNLLKGIGLIGSASVQQQPGLFFGA